MLKARCTYQSCFLSRADANGEARDGLDEGLRGRGARERLGSFRSCRVGLEEAAHEAQHWRANVVERSLLQKECNPRSYDWLV